MSPFAGESEGEAAAAVLVRDSSPPAAAFLERTLFAPLRHFGIPYSVVRADCEFSDALLERIASQRPLVLVPQSGTCAALSDARAARLASACARGLGLVLYEPDAASLPGPLRSLFGLPGDLPKGTLRDVVAQRDDRWIARHKRPGERFRSDAPVACTSIPASGASALTDGRGGDLMLLAEPGEGRAVLFPFDIALYAIENLGHAGGLDDLFTRSLVWAARKPFLCWAMPPMAGLAVDDCSGSYDFFGYLDAMGDRGWMPYLSLFTQTIDEVAHEDRRIAERRLRRGWEEGALEIGFHALRYNESFCFDHLGQRPLSAPELDERFASWDAALRAWGVSHSPWAHPHFGEIGAAAVPYFEARGIEFLTYLLPLDAAWFEVPSRKPPLPPLPPFGHGGYYHLDLPGSASITALNCVLDRKSRESADYVPKTDYLWNRTPFWKESESVDLAGAAATLAEQIGRGLDSGFYGQGATHEQRLACLRKGELAELLAEADRLLSRYAFERVRLSDAMRVARKRRRSALRAVDWDPAARRFMYELSGEEAFGTEFQLYRSGPDGDPAPERIEVRALRGAIDA